MNRTPTTPARTRGDTGPPAGDVWRQPRERNHILLLTNGGSQRDGRTRILMPVIGPADDADLYRASHQLLLVDGRSLV
jgi:hypothetical protein